MEDQLFNKNALDQFGEMGCVVYHLHWIALSLNDDERDDNNLFETLTDIKVEKLLKVFGVNNVPAGTYPEFFNREQLWEFIVQHHRFGFFIEVGKDVCKNFTYRDGKPIGWSSSGSMRRIFYAYAETSKGLLHAIEKENEVLFNDMMALDKKNVEVAKV